MNLAGLERAYSSIFDRPVIHAVDRRIFQLRYFRRCLACGFCNDQCCSHGVDVDLDNVERIHRLSGFQEFVGSPRENWFTDEPYADPEFPSGAHVRTRVQDHYCVFHDRDARGCKIHSWCIRNGLDHRAFKPIVSLLFPVTFENGALVPATEVLDGTLVCSGAGDTLYEGAREELAYLFGGLFIEELDAMAAKPACRAR